VPRCVSVSGVVLNEIRPLNQIFSVTHCHVGVGSCDTVRSPMNPMSLPWRCLVASVIAINFVGKWRTVQKALPGFMNRYVLNSWRAPTTSWNCVILFLSTAIPCYCHLNSTFCVTVSPMPHFLMAAVIPEYSAMGAVCCAGGATVPCIPA